MDDENDDYTTEEEIDEDDEVEEEGYETGDGPVDVDIEAPLPQDSANQQLGPVLLVQGEEAAGPDDSSAEGRTSSSRVTLGGSHEDQIIAATAQASADNDDDARDDTRDDARDDARDSELASLNQSDHNGSPVDARVPSSLGTVIDNAAVDVGQAGSSFVAEGTTDDAAPNLD